MSTKKTLASLAPKLHLRAKSFRQRLLDLHADLFDIDTHVRKANQYHPSNLTTLEKMVMVLEDRRFFNHFGVDIYSVIREFLKFVAFKRHGGASTIDMQLVRTVTGYKQRTLKRKSYECLLAVIIQRRYSKIKILRAYLDCAFFGSHLIGADKAAGKLYGVDSTALSEDQASFIAAMLVSPRPRKPSEQWASRVERRAKYGHAIYIRYKDRFDQLPS